MKKLWISILLIALLTIGCSSKSNNLTLKGDIQNNIISANSTVAGKIIQMDIEQGKSVKQGDTIAVIDNVNQRFAVDQLQAVVNMKKAKLEELQLGARPQQIEQAQAQVRVAKAQLDLLTSGNRTEQIEQAKNGVSVAQEALNSAQTTFDHSTSEYNNVLALFQAGAVPQNDLDNAKYKLDLAAEQVSTAQYQVGTAKQQLQLMQNGSTNQSIEAARANYDAANAQLKLLQKGSTTQVIASAQADLDQSTAQLNQAQNTLNNYTIVALADGIIISKNFQLGDIVNTSSNIADIAIANDIYVLCYIPDKYLDKIYYNQPLTVKTSIGEQTGTVSYIALKDEYTPKDKQSTTDSGNVATKIKVSIKDESGVLKSGMTASVDVPLK